MASFRLVPRPYEGEDWHPPGDPLVLNDERDFVLLGRCRKLAIPPDQWRVSRSHVEARTTPAGRLELTPLKKCYLLKKSSGELLKLAPEEPVLMAIGDVLYLAKVDRQPCYGFILRKSAAKRKPDGLTADRSKAAKSHPLGSPAAPAAAAAAPQLLAGLELVFLKDSFVRVAKQRAAEAGARIAEQIGPRTTHVVVDSKASPAFVARRLGQTGVRPVLPPGVAFVNENFTPTCLQQRRLLPPEQFPVPACLPQEEAGVSEAEEAAGSQPEPASAAAPAEALSAAADSTAAASSALLAAAELQAERAAAKPAPEEAPDALEGAAPESVLQAAAELQMEQEAAPAATSEPAAEARGGSMAAGRYVIAGKPVVVTGGDSGRPWGEGGHWIEPWDDAAAKRTVQSLWFFWQRHNLRHNPEARRREGAVLGQVVEPAPDDTSGGGSDSGSDCDSDGDGEGGGCGQSLPDASAADQPGPAPAQPAAAQRKKQRKCAHVACSASAGCIVAELRELGENQYRGGRDEAVFKLRAVERACAVLETYGMPLRYWEDVERLPLGKAYAKTKQKVWEVVSRGFLQRNAALAADPRTQAVRLFMTVWGAARTTAERWYADGCRSLDDVRARSDLSEKQVAGLRHHADMLLKIPPAEREAVAAAVEAAMLRCFGWAGRGAHVRLMGSALRCKPMTGETKPLRLPAIAMQDIDILAVPPEEERRCPGRLMNMLLQELLAQGLITRDVGTHMAEDPNKKCSAFHGFCRAPGSQHVRRMDIRIFARCTLPFAVNYFTGSGPFNRALRFWATCSDAGREAARWLSPNNSSGCKLSDARLQPRLMGTKDKKLQREALAEFAAQDILCETDIFKKLNLAYVPPHLRFFHNYK